MATLEEMFDAVEDEFLKFDQIPAAERRHPLRDLCGMLYLYEKVGANYCMVCHSEHDEIWFEGGDEAEGKLTEADVVYLHRCGVRYDGESFQMFT